jgi:hypothetical protein
MKCKRNVTVTIIAICLITAAAHAQSRNLVLRFRVPFPFTVKNTTFAAGEYEVTQPGQFVLTLRNVENQASVFAHVLPAGSKKEADGRARAVFHRFGGAYFLATISDGSRQATYDLDRSNKEKVLADKIPARRPEVVSVLTNGTVVTDVGRE